MADIQTLELISADHPLLVDSPVGVTTSITVLTGSLYYSNASGPSLTAANAQGTLTVGHGTGTNKRVGAVPTSNVFIA